MILYVFDIDGTLLRADGAGARAFDRALGEQFELTAAGLGVRFGGKTDPQILDEILVLRRGHGASPAEQRRFLDCYLGHLGGALEHSPGFRVIDGAVAALDYLATCGRAALGLGTGNVQAGAVAKLCRAGLHGRFTFGGYGCDSAVRAELIATAIRRGRALHPEAETVVVVGDTIHDISAARACGAIAIAVTTGSDDREALAHADEVWDSLHALPAWHAARVA